MDWYELKSNITFIGKKPAEWSARSTTKPAADLVCSIRWNDFCSKNVEIYILKILSICAIMVKIKYRYKKIRFEKLLAE